MAAFNYYALAFAAKLDKLSSVDADIVLVSAKIFYPKFLNRLQKFFQINACMW